MRILMLGKAYAPHLGGVETVLRQLAEGMAARGHEVAVLCFGEEPAETRNGVRIYRLRPFAHVGSAPVGWSYYRSYRRLGEWADVVHFHAPNPMGELSHLGVSAPSRAVATYHGDAVRPRPLLRCYDSVMRRFLRRCSLVCPTNPHTAATSRVLSELGKEVRPVPIGVDLKRFESVSQEAERQASSLLEGLEGFKLMFAGRLVYYKGVQCLLEALLQLRDRGVEISAFLVGAGPLEKNCRRFIDENGLSRHVRLMSPQPDAVYTALFRRADCFVLPSLYPVEAFGIVLLEAMASGLPVVSTELGTGTSWVNRNGETGFVVSPGSADELREAVEFLSVHLEERRRMALAARKRVEEHFTEEAMLNAYEEIYRTCMEKERIH